MVRPAVSLGSWKPGTLRWLCLVAGFYAMFAGISIPLPAGAGQEEDWAFVSLVLVGGACNVTWSYLRWRDARQRLAAR